MSASWIRALLTISILVLARTVLAEPLLQPGQIGIFHDRKATDRVWPAGGFIPFYVVARLDALGLTRARFAIETFDGHGYQAPRSVLETGIVDLDPDRYRFDLMIDMSLIEVDSDGLVVLAAIFATELGYWRIIPYDDEDRHPTTTSAAPGAVARPLNWRVPPWQPKYSYLVDPGDYTLGGGQESSVIALRTGADAGDLVTVGLHLVYHSVSSSSRENHNFAYEPTWPMRDITSICESGQGGWCCLCIGYDWVESSIEWNPNVASFESIRPGPGMTTQTVSIVDEGPGFVVARLDGDGDIPHFEQIFDLDLRLDGPEPVTDLVVSSSSSCRSGFCVYGPLGSVRPGRILVGCEPYDVIDDDIIDASDVQATLDMIAGVRAVDDDAVCRADVDADGFLDVVDALRIARRAEGLGEGAPAIAAASLSWRGAESLTLEWAGAAAAEADFATSLAPGTPLTATSDQANVAAYITGDGKLRVVFAQAHTRATRIRVSAPSASMGNSKLTAVRAFDESGGEVDVDASISSTTFGPRVIELGLGHPNPFNPSVRVEFMAEERVAAVLEIVDARGRRVRDLGVRVLEAGPGALEWDGRDDAGAGVASGVYHVRVRVGSEVFERSVTLLK